MNAVRIACAMASCLLLFGCALADRHAASADPLIVVRSTTSTPDEVVARIKTHAENKKWAYLGANKVKNGEITMVKVCIPAVGAALWQASLQLTAMLPCGNISIYGQGGKTEIAMLHPSYMEKLHPAEETRKAVAMATPELMGMLESVAK